MTETIKVDTKAEAEVKLTDRPEHAAKFLHNNGLLFEINQQILHPLGYSLDVIQTEKKFSFMGLDKAGKPLLIETSHTLGSLYEKFGVFKLQIERAKLSEKVMESVKKEFDKVLSDLTKLEPMCGAKFKVWKFTFWISRENDGHDAKNGCFLIGIYTKNKIYNVIDESLDSIRVVDDNNNKIWELKEFFEKVEEDKITILCPNKEGGFNVTKIIKEKPIISSIEDIEKLWKEGRLSKVVIRSATFDILSVFKEENNLRCGTYGTYTRAYFPDINIPETIKLIKEKEMTKSDLKSGMIVEFRNGEMGIIIDTHIGKSILLKNGWIDVINYGEDLKSSYDRVYDFIKIYSIIYRGDVVFDRWSDENLALMWKRKEKSETEIKIEQLEKQAEEIHKTIKELKGKLK